VLPSIVKKDFSAIQMPNSSNFVKSGRNFVVLLACLTSHIVLGTEAAAAHGTSQRVSAGRVCYSSDDRLVLVLLAIATKAILQRIHATAPLRRAAGVIDAPD
jgi:hypothetical protein